MKSLAPQYLLLVPLVAGLFAVAAWKRHTASVPAVASVDSERTLPLAVPELEAPLTGVVREAASSTTPAEAVAGEAQPTAPAPVESERRDAVARLHVLDEAKNAFERAHPDQGVSWCMSALRLDHASIAVILDAQGRYEPVEPGRQVKLSPQRPDEMRFGSGKHLYVFGKSEFVGHEELNRELAQAMKEFGTHAVDMQAAEQLTLDVIDRYTRAQTILSAR